MIPFTQDVSIFYATIYGGILIGVLFDFYRGLRGNFKFINYFAIIFDVLFWFLSTVIIFVTINLTEFFDLRYYHFVALFIGFILYYNTISKIVLSIINKIIRFVRNSFKKVTHYIVSFLNNLYYVIIYSLHLLFDIIFYIPNIFIATRKSKLAQVQTERVMELLKEQQNIDSEKLLVVTEGDKRLDVTLDKIGGKGLFTKEIEIALIEGKADGAVHSMKDVPFQLAEEFELVAMPEREDVRDAFISRKGINFSELRQGAKIGTSSNRRAALLKEIRSDLEIVPIRGNVQTRLKKMEEQELDGIILASAGLKRLGMEEIITDYFDPNIFIPAIGQGALGIECLKNSKNKEYFKALDNKMVRLEVEAERSFMKALNGDCHSLIGAYSIIEGSKIYMIGTYMVNGKIIKKDIDGSIEENIELGKRLAEKVLSCGR